jgi:uncharacterized RDD family membrane protein YckC
MEARVGFGPRLAAWFIDFVILGLLGLALQKAVAGLFPETINGMLLQATEKAGGRPLPGIFQTSLAWSLAVSLVAPLYGLVEGLLGASPGKFILGQRIVIEANTRAGQPQLLARYGIKHVMSALHLAAVFLGIKALDNASNVVSVVFVLGCFMVFGQARQALHDKIVGTAILRKSDLPEPVAATVPGAG